jgi:arylsulfatase A-like enzyme
MVPRALRPFVAVAPVPAALALFALVLLPSAPARAGGREPAQEPPVVPEAPEASAPAGSPSILLVTVDTLRRDHLGCYGYFRDTSPAIDALAREGILFERALAPSASTLPSHLSMLTGLYAHQHDRTSNKDGLRNPFASGPGCASIARELAGAGYRTAAIVSSRVLDQATGIGDGFEHFDSPRSATNPRDARETTRRALDWLDELEGDEPFFLWLHYWDTHEPNRPDGAYATMFETDDRLVEWIGRCGIDTAELTERFRLDASVQRQFVDVGRAGRPVVDGSQVGGPFRSRKRRKAQRPVRIDTARIADLINRYDGDLRTIDDQIGHVFDRLKEGGLWDRTIVAFTADHGQSLGENVFFGHGFITNVNTFVPLVLRFPPGPSFEGIEQPRRVSSLVSLVDMMPTVLARLDERIAPAFRAQIEGTDVLAEDFARPFALTQQSSQFHRGKEQDLKCALVRDRWKYVYRSSGPAELFDLEGAGEGTDVLSENEEVARALRAIVEDLLARKPETTSAAQATPDEELDELLDNLRDLGYVGDE